MVKLFIAFVFLLASTAHFNCRLTARLGMCMYKLTRCKLATYKQPAKEPSCNYELMDAITVR